MQTVVDIDTRRAAILREMAAIRSLRAASLSEQVLRGKRGDGTEVVRGPYFVLSRNVEGRTQSRRVGKGEIDQIRVDVENHKRFLALCREFEELTQNLGELERRECGDIEQLKKKPRSRSNKARKSRE
jgi:hypothetical protein